MSFEVPQEIYLDNNATTQPLPEVCAAMIEVLGEGFGNPSSAHAAGDRARDAIRCARESVASLIGVDPSMIVFTSGGTEANNLVFASALQEGKGRPRIITTSVEHSSISAYCEHLLECGVEVVILPVDRAGRLSPQDVEDAITTETRLVSVQWVNNETGVMQPIAQIGALCQERGVPFHTDAAQAVGKLRMNVSALPIDFLSLTAHKFHGPQGIGALYARRRRWLSPLFWGGSQEGGLRAGTENVPGIVGLGKAAALRLARLDDIEPRLRGLRDRFEHLVLDMAPEAEVNGDRTRRVCNTTNLLFRDIDGEALMAQLDHVGIRCSQSSACDNMRPEPSAVLCAMGLEEEEAYASVRFAVSEQNTMDEIEWAAMQIREICAKLRAFRTTARSGENL